MEDKIYYTEDIIDEVVKRYGYDKKLVDDFYKFYIIFFRNKINKKSDVAYYIPNFGTLFLTLTGVNYSIRHLTEKFKYLDESTHDDIRNKISLWEEKKARVNSNIDKLKELGVKRIAYFNKIRNAKFVKNA